MLKVNITEHAMFRTLSLKKCVNIKKYCTSMLTEIFAQNILEELPPHCAVRDYSKNISFFVEFNKSYNDIIATVSTLGTLQKYPRDGETAVYINENGYITSRIWTKEEHEKRKLNEEAPED